MKKNMAKITTLFLIAALLLAGLFHFFNLRKLNNNKRKILLLCLDGASWRIINPLLEKGELPNIASLMKNGSYGNLICMPPKSYSSWTSLATGCSEEKHGIKGWAYWKRQRKAIWNILSENGVKVGIARWVKNYPAEKINGFIYPSWFEMQVFRGANISVQQKQLPIFYPPQLEKDLKWKFILSNDSKYSSLSSGIEPQDDFFMRNCPYLINKFKPQFLAIGFFGTDSYQHHGWDALEPEYFDITLQEVKEKKSMIINYYKKIDNYLADFINGKSTIIIISDHGARRNDSVSGPRIAGYPDENTKVNFMCNYMLYKLGLLNFVNMEAFCSVNDPHDFQYYKNPGSALIDFSKTQAYFFNNLDYGITGISVNKKGRNLYGVLSENEARQLIKKLYVILKEASFPTGEKVFEDVKITEPEFNSLSPDISFSLSALFKKDNLVFEKAGTNVKAFLKGKGILNGKGDLLSEIIVDDKVYPLFEFINYSMPGTHEANGVIILQGPGIRKNKMIANARNIDIAPTVLYLLGLPLAKDMDGKMLTEIFEPEFLQRNPNRFIKSYEDELGCKIGAYKKLQLDDDTNDILRSLGYLQ